jgi:hypothetical protein
LTEQEKNTAVSDHLFVLAGIAKRKYAYVDYALYAGVAGGVLTCVVLFVQHALK